MYHIKTHWLGVRFGLVLFLKMVCNTNFYTHLTKKLQPLHGLGVTFGLVLFTCGMRHKSLGTQIKKRL